MYALLIERQRVAHVALAALIAREVARNTPVEFCHRHGMSILCVSPIHQFSSFADLLSF